MLNSRDGMINNDIEFKELGYNIFEKPFEYMKYEEKEIIFEETGINPFEKPFEYMKYNDRIYY